VPEIVTHSKLGLCLPVSGLGVLNLISFKCATIGHITPSGPEAVWSDNPHCPLTVENGFVECLDFRSRDATAIAVTDGERIALKCDS